jgi:hypothetical protein
MTTTPWRESVAEEDEFFVLGDDVPARPVNETARWETTRPGMGEVGPPRGVPADELGLECNPVELR